MGCASSVESDTGHLGVFSMMKRIEHLEAMYDACLDCIEKMECMLDAFDSMEADMDELNAYYASGWLSDYESDEAHPLPCKKGILSEDGLYDLLERYDALKKRID